MTFFSATELVIPMISTHQHTTPHCTLSTHIYISTIHLPKGHGGYALSFFVCEVLALVNVIVQIYFTDA